MSLPALLPSFPSIAHRMHLRQKSYSARTTEEKWFMHSYDYGWRRVMLEDFDDRSPVDPERAWLNYGLVAAAEGMWRKHLNRPLPVKRPDPTPEEIADVERMCNIARAAIAEWVERNSRVFGRRRKRDPIAEARAALNVTVTDQVPDTIRGKPWR